MKIFILILILLPHVGPCQASDSLAYKRISLGVLFSPDYCYRRLEYDADSKWVSDRRNADEIPKYGFTAGATIRYYVNKRFTLESGIVYSDKGEKTKKRTLTWAIPESSFPTHSVTTYHYRFFELPLALNYYFQLSRFRFYIATGASVNIFLERKTTIELIYGNSNKSRSSSSADLGFKKITYSVLASCGMDYSFNKRLTLNIEPRYRGALSSILENDKAGDYLYSVGIGIGVYYSFLR